MARRSPIVAVAGSVLAALLAGAPGAEALALGVNPVRKVVNLLQQMQKKVTEEGEKEGELYEKFECWCKTGAKNLTASIAEAEEKIESLGAELKADAEEKAKLEEDLKQHKADREAAIKAIAEATAIREKEAAEYAKLKAEHGTNDAALKKAIGALERGMAGAFLQSDTASVLRKFAQGGASEDRRELLAFLSGSSSYAPQSGQIVGILKTMHDEMMADYHAATETEEGAIQFFEELMAAKTKEKELASQAIEKKTARVAELGIALAEKANDLEDTQEAMAADNKFIANLEEGCAKKKAEWEERCKLRAEELVALADTIKVLNDDDALELFKATLPSGASSFLQMQVTAASAKARAVAALKEGLRFAGVAHRARLDTIFLALHGKKVGFEKVIQLIDEMVASLKTEQADDGTKKEYCVTSLDTSDDKKKELERKVSDLEAAIASAEESIATLKEEIASLEGGIAALDKSVAEATENRKAENIEFKELMASNTAAKEVLLFAQNRLNKFYNPKLYKARAKTELSKEDRIASSMSGTEPPTAAPGGIAGTGIAVLAQVSAHTQRGEVAPPPPETFGAYTKASQENNGVTAMINMLIQELEKEMTVAAAEEKDAQEDYETMMQDSAEKRAADSKSITEKEAAKADTEAALQQHQDDKASTGKELAATLEFIASLHAECDWILKYHEVRKEARASEIDALGKAKAVLSGADFSLLQTSGAHGILRRTMA